MARILFLFNHDQLHQIAHSLPIALTMAREQSHEVVIASGHKRIAQFLADQVKDHHRPPRIVLLSLERPLSKLLAASIDHIIPARKILLYRDNLDFFRKFDAVVVSEKTSLILKSRYGLTNLKLIHTRHGAGDRAIGFDTSSGKFDLVLASGNKIASRLIDDARVDPAKIRLVGYPKFDRCADNRIDNPFPDKSRPIVLYAPHPSPKLSSYYAFGRVILAQLARSDKFNVIFAPHVMLFQRSVAITVAPPALRRVPPIEPWIEQCPHILIDRGSPRSSDMSYTNLADIYCGDVSSQIYEFLLRPRPVLNIDAHHTRWQGDPNYAHWRAGPVSRDPFRIIEDLENAKRSHAEYIPIQRNMLEQTFAIADEPASDRAAAAIADYLEETIG